MTQIVEIFGPSAVGKSYLLKEMYKEKNKMDDWVPWYRLEALKNGKKYYAKRLADHLLSKFSFHMALKGEKKNLGVEFSHQNSAFCTRYFDIINDKYRYTDNKCERLKYLYYPVSTFEKYQRVVNSDINSTVVIDEAIISSLYTVVAESADTKIIDSLLDVAPLPKGAIFLTSSAENMAERYIQREVKRKFAPQYDYDTLVSRQRLRHEVFNKVYLALRERKIPVLKTDPICDYELTKSRALDFMRKVVNN